MPRTRGAANQSLYRARLLLAAWDRSRSEPIPEAQLHGAFYPAVRLHLREAYGWFLLAVSGVAEAPVSSLPSSTASLPSPEPGKARMPEVAEFERLERQGWLAQLLTGDELSPQPRAAEAGLLVSDREAVGTAVLRSWVDELEATMARMDDSLNEY